MTSIGMRNSAGRPRHKIRRWNEASLSKRRLGVASLASRWCSGKPEPLQLGSTNLGNQRCMMSYTNGLKKWCFFVNQNLNRFHLRSKLKLEMISKWSKPPITKVWPMVSIIRVSWWFLILSRGLHFGMIQKWTTKPKITNQVKNLTDAYLASSIKIIRFKSCHHIRFRKLLEFSKLHPGKLTANEPKVMEVDGSNDFSFLNSSGAIIVWFLKNIRQIGSWNPQWCRVKIQKKKKPSKVATPNHLPNPPNLDPNHKPMEKIKVL